MEELKIIITEKDITASIWLINKPGSQLRATAKVKIGPIEIDGFRIIESKNNEGAGVFLDAPVRKSAKGSNFVKTTWVYDSNLWMAIQKVVIKKYIQTLKEKNLS